MAFPPAPTTLLPVLGSDVVVPVRHVYCVGKNYAAHAAEMGGRVSEDAPFFFTKHPLDIVLSGETIDYPAGTRDLHFELELVAVVGKRLCQANLAEARDAIFGYAVGIDLTRRDLQQHFKDNRLPWALSKSFSNAAVISPVITGIDAKTRDAQTLTLKKNGNIHQHAPISDMARSVEELLVYLSQLDTLDAGDILFTGTPAGVGAVGKGEQLHGTITNIGEVIVNIAE